MDDAMGPVGAGILGVSLYLILKAMWWAGEYDTPVRPPFDMVAFRRSQRVIIKRSRTD